MPKKQPKRGRAESRNALTGAELDDWNALVNKMVANAIRKFGVDYLVATAPSDDIQTDWLSRYLATPRFLQTSYRLEKTSQKARHRLGGNRGSASPPCSACGTPLVLFADLDATDRRLKGDHRLKRLPLYYCCSCPGPVYYQVASNGKVNVIRTRRTLGEEAPFENPPQVLRPAYLTLKPIRSEIELALFKGNKLDQFDSLSRSELAEIATILGRKPSGRWEMYFSQIGGVPLSFQGEEGKPRICPNRGCPFRRRKQDECKFRPLAVLDLWNDDFWPIKPLDAVQIVFHICPGCHCVSAKYTCT